MKLFFREYGAGRPLVILHGLFGASDNWQSLATRFAEGFHVLVPDLRNHGQSPHSGEMDYSLMAGDVAELLADRGVASADVIGHSMGGKVAMQLALAQPQLVQKLVVVDMAPRAYTPLHNEIISALTALDVGSYTTRQEIEGVLEGPLPSLNLRRFLLKNLNRGADGKFGWKINLTGLAENYPHLRVALTASHPFTGPTLFVRGGKSDYIRVTGEPSIKELFPQATVQTIETAGHWVNAEAPEELLRLVRGFLG
jgi:esterase